ncbi:MAG: hypothetical protein WCJ66_00270 [Verrucomicrobiota bacterium]
MKIHRPIIAAILIVVFGIITTVTIALRQNVGTENASHLLEVGSPLSADHKSLLQQVNQSPEDISWAEHNVIAARFDTHVRFWGKVVDQDGAPVEGVEIVASVTTLRMIKTEHGYREYEILKATTDSGGAFILNGPDGMFLDIEAMGKPGYVLPSAYQFGMSCKVGAKFRFQYSSVGSMENVYTPNADRPEIFHMWKLNMPEPLVIRGDGSGLSGPELMLGSPPERLGSISMVVISVGTSQAPQWEVTVSANSPDGGIVMAEPSDIFMFEAPKSGYTQSIKYRYGPDGTDQGAGDPGASLRFFSRTHNGRWYVASQYAFFSPDQNGTVLTEMRIWLNPNGSRNLEHDGGHPLPQPSLK